MSMEWARGDEAMSIIGIHGWLSDVVVLYAALMGVWGLLNFAQRQGISEGYWWGLVIGELLILTQGSLGGLLWFQGRQPEQGIHLFYGVVAAVGIPAVYVGTRGREGRRESLAYGIAALVVALLAWLAAASAA